MFNENYYNDFKSTLLHLGNNVNAIKEKCEDYFTYMVDNNDYEDASAFVCTINHICWELYDTNPDLSKEYSDLYYKYDNEVINWLDNYNKSKNYEDLEPNYLSDYIDETD